MNRRRLLGTLCAGLAGPAAHLARAAADDNAAAVAALRQGGVVVVMRHALAPGTFDPPGFTLGDCRTQRNLNDVGREQARQIGAWFRGRGLKPAAVRSSQWCRCRETATLAFGNAIDWPALNSLFRAGAQEASTTAELRAGLAQVPRGRFEIWLTHQVNISALAGESTAPGEAVVLRAGGPDQTVQVVARLRIE